MATIDKNITFKKIDGSDTYKLYPKTLSEQVLVDLSNSTTVKDKLETIDNTLSNKSDKNHTHDIATTTANGLMSASDKEKLNGIAANANNYSLPTASSSVLGGVKSGNNITNTSGTLSVTKKNVTDALGYIPTNESGAGSANGYATLDNNGKVPSSQLPSFVDDVIEGYYYNNKFYKEAAHTTLLQSESGKIYIDLSSQKIYRWGGSSYAVISETLALGETSTTAYRGDRGKTAYDHSQTSHAPSNAQRNVQSDWNEISTSSDAYIKNKPGLATTTANGLMSASDKEKLNGIAANANNYSHPTTAGNKHIPLGGSSNQYLKYSSSGTATWASLPTASSSTAGIVSVDTNSIDLTNGKISLNSDKVADIIGVNNLILLPNTNDVVSISKSNYNEDELKFYEFEKGYYNFEPKNTNNKILIINDSDLSYSPHKIGADNWNSRPILSNNSNDIKYLVFSGDKNNNEISFYEGCTIYTPDYARSLECIYMKGVIALHDPIIQYSDNISYIYIKTLTTCYNFIARDCPNLEKILIENLNFAVKDDDFNNLISNCPLCEVIVNNY